MRRSHSRPAPKTILRRNNLNWNLGEGGGIPAVCFLSLSQVWNLQRLHALLAGLVKNFPSSEGNVPQCTPAARRSLGTWSKYLQNWLIGDSIDFQWKCKELTHHSAPP